MVIISEYLASCAFLARTKDEVKGIVMEGIGDTKSSAKVNSI